MGSLTLGFFVFVGTIAGAFGLGWLGGYIVHSPEVPLLEPGEHELLEVAEYSPVQCLITEYNRLGTSWQGVLFENGTKLLASAHAPGEAFIDHKGARLAPTSHSGPSGGDGLVRLTPTASKRLGSLLKARVAEHIAEAATTHLLKD